MSKWADAVYAPPPASSPWRLEDVYPGRELRFFSFGRRALAAGLKAAGVKPGDAVLFPGFICRDLLSAAAAVGAKPEFYSVGPDLKPSAEPASWKKSAAVVAVNYFGFEQDLAPFEEYSKRTGAVVIEDNAHGLFSHSYDGKPLGTRADYGILSLRKTLPLQNGAALLAEPGRHLDDQLPFAALPRGGAKKAARAVAGKIGAKAMGKALSAFRKARGNAPDTGEMGEIELPLPESPCAELASPILAGGPVEESQRRRALHAELEALLAPAGFPPLLGAPHYRCVPYAYAYRAEGAAEAAAEKLLSKLGLRSLPWPDLPAAVRSAAPLHYRGVRLAHFLW